MDVTGYVSWGEYPMNFAAVLNQEEIYRLIIAKVAGGIQP